MGDSVDILDVLIVGAVPEHDWAAILGSEYRVMTADTPSAALALLEGACAMVVSDAGRSAEAGLSLLQAIERRSPHVIRMMSAPVADASLLVSAINEARVFAFLPQPLDVAETRRQFERAARLYRDARKQAQALARLRTAASHTGGQVPVDGDAIASSAQVDPVTDLWNRQHLVERLEDEANRLKRYDIPFGVLMVEVDEAFERPAAELLAEFVRRVDVCSRFEANTFLVLCPNTDEQGMERLPERVRHAFSRADLPGSPVGDLPDLRLTPIAVTEAPAPPDEVLARLREARKNSSS